MALVRMGNDLEHTMRNRSNPSYQIFVFEETPKLIENLLGLTASEEQGNQRH